MKTTYIAGLMCLSLVGCTTNIHPTQTENPPPAQKFSDFQCLELAKLAAGDKHVAEQKAALVKIQENIDASLQPELDKWNKKNCTSDTNNKTLLIEPTISNLKFVGAGKRVWVGALGGSSAVLMHVRFSDKESGIVIATPEFYSKSSAMAGAYSFGVNDNAMLVRIAKVFSAYVVKNYQSAVGGSVKPINLN
ncbi:hypothetical protein [Methylomarinum vadi]|uniref:hypothetical protein n=1 Tax=Methylomarinum vadi TaxID=438855 RepID=UPI0004DF2139|nr:hypothetical protein [Methylomarinum vadi]